MDVVNTELKYKSLILNPIEIEKNSRIHDRFLCIDDTVYHIGASIKDLGKKLFAFSRMELKTEELLSHISHSQL